MSHFFPKPYQTEAITIRVHIDTLDSIHQSCALLHLSRNKFINQCIHFAMQHMAPQPENATDHLRKGDNQQ